MVRVVDRGRWRLKVGVGVGVVVSIIVVPIKDPLSLFVILWHKIGVICDGDVEGIFANTRCYVL